MTKNSYSASILARTAKLSVLCNELVENYHINPGSIHIAIRLPKCISLEEYHSWCQFRTPLSFPEQGVTLSLEAWTYLEWSNLFSVETLSINDPCPPIGQEPSYDELSRKTLTVADLVASENFRKELSVAVQHAIEEHVKNSDMYAALNRVATYYSIRNMDGVTPESLRATCERYPNVITIGTVYYPQD